MTQPKNSLIFTNIVRDYRKIEDRVIDTLSDTQVQVIREFNPCLLPPASLKDPVRVGQAKDNTQMAQFLAGARRLPPEKRPAEIDRLVDAEEHYLGLAGQYEQEYKQQRRKFLAGLLEEAAAMSEADFAAHERDLARRAEPADVKSELRFKLEGLYTYQGLPGQIAATLLFDPHMPTVLTTRAQQLAAPVKMSRRDIHKGPQAENTDGTQGALPGRKYGRAEKK